MAQVGQRIEIKVTYHGFIVTVYNSYDYKSGEQLFDNEKDALAWAFLQLGGENQYNK